NNITMSGAQGVLTNLSTLLDAEVNVNISSRSTVQLKGGTTVSAGSSLTVSSPVNIVMESGKLSAGSNLTMNASKTANLTIGPSAELSAGTLQVGAPDSGPLSSTQVATAGSIKLTSLGLTGTNIMADVSITTNGGSVSVSASKGPLTIG